MTKESVIFGESGEFRIIKTSYNNGGFVYCLYHKRYDIDKVAYWYDCGELINNSCKTDTNDALKSLFISLPKETIEA